MHTRQIVINSDCRSLALEDIAQCDVMITDPPYSEHTHKKAVSCTGSNGVLSNARKRDFGFEHLGDDLREWTARAAGKVKRWSVIFSDIESTHLLRASAKDAGATYIRTLAWIRWSMPQLSGDRPPSSREDLLIFHADDPVTDVALFYGAQKGKKAWNGPGNLTHLQHKCLRGSGKHPTEKPLDLAMDLVSWFSDPGETVFDPFAGSGSIGLACALLGRNYVGFELSPEWAEKAKARIAEGLAGRFSDRDTERLARFNAAKGSANAAE